MTSTDIITRARPGGTAVIEAPAAVPDRLAAALQAVADILGTEGFGLTATMSCLQADALALLLHLAGHDGPAAWMLAGHAVRSSGAGEKHGHIVFTDGREDCLDAAAALEYLAALAAGEPRRRHRCQRCQGLHDPDDAGSAPEAGLCPTCSVHPTPPSRLGDDTKESQ